MSSVLIISRIICPPHSQHLCLANTTATHRRISCSCCNSAWKSQSRDRTPSPPVRRSIRQIYGRGWHRPYTPCPPHLPLVAVDLVQVEWVPAEIADAEKVSGRCC